LQDFVRENNGFYMKFAKLKRIIFCVLSSGRHTCITGGQSGTHVSKEISSSTRN
jgi:hypothetical protein